MIKNKTITNILIFVLVGILSIAAMFYLYPKTAVGNPICKQMSNDGYYETEWDTVGFKDCKILHDSKWDPFETNKNCMEEREESDFDNMYYFKYHCVWGGPGWMLFVVYMGIPFVLFVFLISGVFDILHHYKIKKV